MKEEFELKSRYGDIHRLIREGDETSMRYRLETEYNFRVGLIEGNQEQFSFIDPAGGPFLTIGSEVEGHVIKAIHRGCIIEFES